MPNKKINTEHTKFFFYILFIAVILVLFFLLRSYLSLMLLAIITVTVFQPLYSWLKEKFKGHTGLATAVSIVLILLVILLPILFVINLVIDQAGALANDLSIFVTGNTSNISGTIQNINHYLNRIPGVDFQITSGEVVSQAKQLVKPVGNFLVENIVSFSNSSINFIPNLVLYIYLLAVLFPAHKSLIKLAKKLSPLDDKLDDIYLRRTASMAKTMARGALLIAIVQAALSGLTLWLVGVDYTIFWTLIMVVAALIPLGVGIILIPMSIVLLLLGHVWQALVVLGFYAIVTSNIDNLMRAKMAPKDGSLHPLLLLLSVFGGIKLFGFLGFLYGPILMIFIVTTFEIYLKYYQKNN